MASDGQDIEAMDAAIEEALAEDLREDLEDRIAALEDAWERASDIFDLLDRSKDRDLCEELERAIDALQDRITALGVDLAALGV